MAVKKTILNDLETIKGANSTFFTGVDDLINLNFDPIVTGYAYIYWVQLPSWFDRDPDLKYFKQMTQKNFRSFQGLTEITLNTAQHQTGFGGAEFDVATGITKGNEEFTLAHKEYSGGIIRKMYQKWVSYIRDPKNWYCDLSKIIWCRLRCKKSYWSIIIHHGSSRCYKY